MLPASSAINPYGLDGKERRSGLPGIGERLLAPSRREPVSEQKSLLIRGLMTAIGLAPRGQRELGSCVIDEQHLGDGDGWQNWPAFHHHVDMERQARIRFYLPKPGATSAEGHAPARGVEHDYKLLSRLEHDGTRHRPGLTAATYEHRPQFAKFCAAECRPFRPFEQSASRSSRSVRHRCSSSQQGLVHRPFGGSSGLTREETRRSALPVSGS